MGIYSALTPWYDRLFPVGKVQAEFLVDHLREMGVHRVLDAGCGTGRHLEILADAGFEVAGFEPEADMLEQARLRLSGRGELRRLLLHEAREMSGAPFDAVLCLGNTLAHLEGDDKLADGLGALSSRMRPGGFFIAQLVHFEKVLREGRDPFEDRRLEDGSVFRRSYGFERAPERLDFSLSFSGPGVNFEETIPLRPWTLAELEPAFAKAGMAISDVLGDWTGARREADSPATIILASII